MGRLKRQNPGGQADREHIIPPGRSKAFFRTLLCLVRPRISRTSDHDGCYG